MVTQTLYSGRLLGRISPTYLFLMFEYHATHQWQSSTPYSVQTVGGRSECLSPECLLQCFLQSEKYETVQTLVSPVASGALTTAQEHVAGILGSLQKAPPPPLLEASVTAFTQSAPKSRYKHTFGRGISDGGYSTGHAGEPQTPVSALDYLVPHRCAQKSALGDSKPERGARSAVCIALLVTGN